MVSSINKPSLTFTGGGSLRPALLSCVGERKLVIGALFYVAATVSVTLPVLHAAIFMWILLGNAVIVCFILEALEIVCWKEIIKYLIQIQSYMHLLV